MNRDQYGGMGWIIACFVAVVLATVAAFEWHTIGHIQEIESQRARLSIAAVFENERRRIATFANSVDEWDDEVFEADAVGGAASAMSAASATSATSGGVRQINLMTRADRIFVLDDRGHTRLAMVNGPVAAARRPMTPDPTLVRELIARAQATGLAVTGYFGRANASALRR